VPGPDDNHLITRHMGDSTVPPTPCPGP
jgi:hypothetical protein